MHTLVTPETDFSNISWIWICYQHAFSAIYQTYFWKVTLFADAIFITDMIVYTYAEFGRNCLNNKWNITHCSECCVGSLLQYIYEITWQLNLFLYVSIMWRLTWEAFHDTLWLVHGQTPYFPLTVTRCMQHSEFVKAVITLKIYNKQYNVGLNLVTLTDE